MEIISTFLEYASRQYGINFPENIATDGIQHRYKLPGDKGCSTSGFLTFYLDDNPVAIFGDWKQYGRECFKWFYRDQNELSKKERDEYKARMRESMRLAKEEDQRRKKAAAVKAGELWSMPALFPNHYQYLADKRVGAYGVKFYDTRLAFEYFASDERKAKRDAGEITVYPGVVMVLPVQNQQDQLVSLQQIAPNGKFKGFLPDGMKKGCFHVIPGNDKFVFVAEGYATAATIFELTRCTTYVAFDCGNLEAVCMAVIARHPQATKVIASDDDRFTHEPIKNPGQAKAIAICEKTDFHNLKPEFGFQDGGTDWNDLAMYRSREELQARIRKFLRSVLRA